jgi:hypothetical protein
MWRKLLGMPPKPHFRAHVKVRPTEEGGRRSAFTLYRYRPDLSFAVDNRCYYGAHAIRQNEDQEGHEVWIAPGEEFDTDFWIRSAASQIMSRLEVGSHFRMMEGPVPVGDGTVTRIYRTDE